MEISEKTSIVCGHFQILLIKTHLERTSDHTHYISCSWRFGFNVFHFQIFSICRIFIKNKSRQYQKITWNCFWLKEVVRWQIIERISTWFFTKMFNNLNNNRHRCHLLQYEHTHSSYMYSCIYTVMGKVSRSTEKGM